MKSWHRGSKVLVVVVSIMTVGFLLLFSGCGGGSINKSSKTSNTNESENTSTAASTPASPPPQSSITLNGIEYTVESGERTYYDDNRNNEYSEVGDCYVVHFSSVTNTTNQQILDIATVSLQYKSTGQMFYSFVGGLIEYTNTYGSGNSIVSLLGGQSISDAYVVFELNPGSINKNTSVEDTGYNLIFNRDAPGVYPPIGQLDLSNL